MDGVMRVYDVALWRCWPSLFPEQVSLVLAPSAFAAIESLMHEAQVARVARAVATTRDGQLAYRAWKVSTVLAHALPYPSLVGVNAGAWAREGAVGSSSILGSLRHARSGDGRAHGSPAEQAMPPGPTLDTGG